MRNYLTIRGISVAILKSIYSHSSSEQQSRKSGFLNKCKILTGYVLILAITTVSHSSFSEAKGSPPVSPVKIYTLEKLRVLGSDRLGAASIASLLQLKPGTPLNDDVVMNARQSLLGLGLFKSALLYMRKGSTPGKAILIVELEDDETVLGSWGIGSDVSITHGEAQVRTSVDPDSPPLGYRIGLISRNLLNQLHRGSVQIDFDPKGSIMDMQLAYGFPRFALEDIQFDTLFQATDTQHRYLNSMAFGISGQALWSQDRGDFKQFQYGLGMFLNRDRYSMPNFPKTVMGPKIAYHKETRLLGFIPSAGYNYGLAVIPSPLAFKHSLISISAAKTFAFASHLFFTVDTQIMTVGTKGISGRFTSRLDVPLITKGGFNDDLAEFFLLMQAGSDQYDDDVLSGYSAIVGLRYHSSGLIAELALKVTKFPTQFDELINIGGK